MHIFDILNSNITPEIFSITKSKLLLSIQVLCASHIELVVKAVTSKRNLKAYCSGENLSSLKTIEPRKCDFVRFGHRIHFICCFSNFVVRFLFWLILIMIEIREQYKAVCLGWYLYQIACKFLSGQRACHAPILFFSL